ncbi:MAG: cytochrome d ubiquinol oxidase subunit II [Bacteroidales bacterium]|jgi:cytochrome d ubiquinol oxidase subunit II|nr:cytochrome d ubiquinol oxidase subunit II [Bacteroidales bacterium]
MTTYHFLQLYWWAIVSLLGALLVFLLFVQGGQTLLYGTAKNENQRNILLTIFGHKWEITYTTLITFGGAAFASFPLFYSTSFGGAYWLWIFILLVFVVQAFSYEFRNKEHNLLGKRTYDGLLMINGWLGTILLGVAVGSFLTGGNFNVDKMNITIQSSNVISYWTNDWKGLELIMNPVNILLGVTVLFAARVLALLYTVNQCRRIGGDDAMQLAERAGVQLKISAIGFLVLFVVFVYDLFMMNGYKVNVANAVNVVGGQPGSSGTIVPEAHAYLHNMLQVPWILVLLLIGVVMVLAGLAGALFCNNGRCALCKKCGINPDSQCPFNKHAFYVVGFGVVLAVWAILLSAGFNDTAYYPSLYDSQTSLTLYNSSSSFYTLKVMAYVSIAVPFVVWYIAYVWSKMNAKKGDKSDY